MVILAKSLSSKLFPHNFRIVRVNDKVIHFSVSSYDNSAHISRSDLPLLMSLIRPSGFHSSLPPLMESVPSERRLWKMM